jgi:hypothetical protein
MQEKYCKRKSEKIDYTHLHPTTYNNTLNAFREICAPLGVTLSITPWGSLGLTKPNVAAKIGQRGWGRRILEIEDIFNRHNCKRKN